MSAGQMLRQGRSYMCCSTNCIPIAWWWRKTFLLTHELEQHESSKWQPTERGDLGYLWVLHQQPVLGQELRSSGGQMFHCMGRADNQLIATVTLSKAATPCWFVVVELNHSWWWPFKSPTNRKEACTSSACKATIDVSKQSKILSSRSGLR